MLCRKWLLLLGTFLFLAYPTRAQQMDEASLSNYRKGRSLYEEGERERTGAGREMNYEKAFGLYQESSSLGFPMGEYSLAYMYYKGLGCAQDYTKAVALFRRGAAQGFDNSMYGIAT